MSLISWLISPSRAGKQADNKEETEEQEKPEAAILDSGSEDERDDNIFVKDSEDISVLQRLAKDQEALPNHPLQKLFIRRNLERTVQTPEVEWKQV